MNFDQAPMLVIWEITQACDLACVHCRASAQSSRHPQELNTAQGFELLDQIKSFGNPLMVFTGGDPLKRPDLYDLIRYSVKIGLRTNVTPSATPLLTKEAIDGFKAAGVTRMAISLDGPDAASHDDFRGVPGTFERAMFALNYDGISDWIRSCKPPSRSATGRACRRLRRSPKTSVRGCGASSF